MKCSRLIAALLLVHLLATPGQAETLRFVLDDYCPYYCKDSSQNTPQLAELPGYVVEILQYTFSQPNERLEFEFHPWERGLHGTNRGKFTGIIMAAKNEAPDLLFSRHEQGRSVGCYYGKPTNPWRYNGIDSVSQVHLLLINGYQYGEPLNSYLLDPARVENRQVAYLSGNFPLMRIFQMLQRDRGDATMDDRAVADYELYRLGLQKEFINLGCSEGIMDFYVGFSPVHKNAQALADRLSAAMDELRASGQLDKILAKYGMTDWRNQPTN